MTDTTRFTPEQRERLIQFSQDPGSRGLYDDEGDTESRVELEAYVVARDLRPEEPAAA